MLTFANFLFCRQADMQFIRSFERPIKIAMIVTYVAVMALIANGWHG